MIDPISAVAINPASANQATTQGLADSSNLSTSWSSGTDVLTIRATDMTPSQMNNPLTGESFENLARGVHKGEEFSLPNAQNPMQVDNNIVTQNMKSLAPEFDVKGNSVVDQASHNKVQDAMNAMEKTFEHATFSAMVTQVASGVSNSVRMLARQS